MCHTIMVAKKSAEAIMRQDPISAYALIGDTRSAALCSTSGSIDWLCAPRFDSDFLFAALIGGDEGGRFLLAPSSSREVSRRRYIPGTNVLETTWTTDSGKVVLTDAMIANLSGSLLPEQLLIRQVRAEGGSAKLQFLFDPKLGGRNPPKRIERRNGHLICHWGSLVVAITSEIDIDAGPGVPREFELAAGGEATFLLSVNDRSPIVFVALKVRVRSSKMKLPGGKSGHLRSITRDRASNMSFVV